MPVAYPLVPRIPPAGASKLRADFAASLDVRELGWHRRPARWQQHCAKPLTSHVDQFQMAVKTLHLLFDWLYTGSHHTLFFFTLASQHVPGFFNGNVLRHRVIPSHGRRPVPCSSADPAHVCVFFESTLLYTSGALLGLFIYLFINSDTSNRYLCSGRKGGNFKNNSVLIHGEGLKAVVDWIYSAAWFYRLFSFVYIIVPSF